MTENEKRQKPYSSPNKIIIELNENSYTFDKRSYKLEYLNGIIEKEEWDTFISDASKLMGQSWGKKKTNDQIKLPNFLILSAVVCVLLSLVYMITLYIAATSEGNNTVLITVAIITVSVATISTAILATYNFKRELGKFRSLDEIMQEDIDEFLNAINSKHKGKLYFVYMPNTKWIECNILDSRNYRTNPEEGRHLMANDIINTERVAFNRDEENGGRWSDRERDVNSR